MQLEATSDSTSLSYWLNWRVFLCAIWVLTPMMIAFFMIWKYEGQKKNHSSGEEMEGDIIQFPNDGEAWRPCLGQIHPIWLLTFRFTAFSLLLTTLIVKVSFSGVAIFYYYTQWTFTLLTIYFACGSVLSTYGCYHHHKTRTGHDENDQEEGLLEPRTEKVAIRSCGLWDVGIWSYIFDVLFQMNAGAVMLTDCVYWFVIFPFLTDYNLNVMTVTMHSLNFILLMGDMALNSLRIPLFRFYFFVLWTGVFIISQWIIHASVSIRWPYPFLDLSSPYAPLWYLLLALIHIPCYCIFALIVEIKHYILSKWLPLSYQC